jgi:glycerol uptake facilitator-like aquaporin
VIKREKKRPDSRDALWRRALAEFIGTALLLMAIVGAGIAAQRLSPHDVGLELLEDSLATGLALAAIILAVGPICGAHLNPVVTLADRLLGGISWKATGVYWVTQVAGGIFGSLLANAMFSLAVLQVSTKHRSGVGLWLGEVIATFGLLLVIFAVVRSGRVTAVPGAVGAYIAAAYWFTSSTSFANPAVTIARMFSNTFSGIAPASAPGFVVGQFIGMIVAVGTIKALYPRITEVAGQVVVPHGDAARQSIG